MELDASNSIYESLHPTASYGLSTCGTARFGYMCALGQTNSNNSFGRTIQTAVTRQKAKQSSTLKKKKKPIKSEDCGIGEFLSS